LLARAYFPGNLRRGSPLVVVLHGCTQTAAAYDRGSGWSELADRYGFALLFPEQQRANNANLCFNWFVPADIQRDGGEVLSIRQMIEAVVTERNLDRKRIFITGLSAGGAMTSAMLAAYPEVFAGGAIIAGLPYGTAATIPEAFDRMRGHGGPAGRQLEALVRNASAHDGPWPTISIWHGGADRTVSPSNAVAIAEQWRGLHGAKATPTRTVLVDGYRRQVWCDPEGREVVEFYSIAAMGHGTPLNTEGPEGCGESGPFMIDVGISSTVRIAGFWGIAAKVLHPGNSNEAVPLEGELLPPGTPLKTERRTYDRGPAAPAGDGVGAVIERALRAAGLMK
jgi:poly(hydroxyalkanoate) depolymerase family esterase